MSVEECFRKAEAHATALGTLFDGSPIKVTLNQGRVYVLAYDQSSSKLFWTEKRAGIYFEKLVKKHGLEVQSLTSR